MKVKLGVLTASDRSAAGDRPDLTAGVIRELVQAAGWEVTDYRIVPDDRRRIAAALRHMADSGLSLVLTTGGTGLGPRDVTPEATADVIERPVPGLGELMREAGRRSTPRAALSRALAGIRGRTLIVNLPGSPRGARESLESLLEVLPHALEVLAGEVTDCGHPA
ncbi:MAG: MogA/MoaB family molybdenum cofactor biosynthesis protein [bacterium]|nr:MogA/MoaB family molybdenum cofactor biosynthesis protein [bacterium]